MKSKIAKLAVISVIGTLLSLGTTVTAQAQTFTTTVSASNVSATKVVASIAKKDKAAIAAYKAAKSSYKAAKAAYKAAKKVIGQTFHNAVASAKAIFKAAIAADSSAAAKLAAKNVFDAAKATAVANRAEALAALGPAPVKPVKPAKN